MLGSYPADTMYVSTLSTTTADVYSVQFCAEAADVHACIDVSGVHMAACSSCALVALQISTLLQRNATVLRNEAALSHAINTC